MAFASQLKPLMEPLLRYFARRVDPRDDAYDCLSETLLVIWRRRASAPANPDELRAWSYGIAKLTLANHTRGQRRRQRLLAKAHEAFTPPEETFTEETDILAVLAPRDRELVRLIVWDGLGVAEAGQVLGLKPAAARTRYSRARAALRQTLKEN